MRESVWRRLWVGVVRFHHVFDDEPRVAHSAEQILEGVEKLHGSMFAMPAILRSRRKRTAVPGLSPDRIPDPVGKRSALK